jgi:putative tributyrin esterase
MALAHLQYWSAAIGVQTSMYVVVPQTPGPHPVIYQLHGWSDDCSIWHRRTTIEAHAERIGAMVVMLEGGRGFYTNKINGTGNWESHILESIALVDGMFKTRSDRGGRAIGGLSMGGYGACKMGLKHPQLFTSVVSHSGALHMRTRFAQLAESPEMKAELTAVFGSGVGAADDLFELAQRATPLPRLSIDCGVEDFLLEDNRAFHRHLDQLRIPHAYQELPGNHEWPYWEAQLQRSFDFHKAAFVAPP